MSRHFLGRNDELSSGNHQFQVGSFLDSLKNRHHSHFVPYALPPLTRKKVAISLLLRYRSLMIFILYSLSWDRAARLAYFCLHGSHIEVILLEQQRERKSESFRTVFAAALLKLTRASLKSTLGFQTNPFEDLLLRRSWPVGEISLCGGPMLGGGALTTVVALFALPPLGRGHAGYLDRNRLHRDGIVGS